MKIVLMGSLFFVTITHESCVHGATTEIQMMETREACIAFKDYNKARRACWVVEENNAIKKVLE